MILVTQQPAEVKMLDVASLPTVPLSMAVLLHLDSQPLRRLLKQGLRRGLLQEELDQLFAADWYLAPDSLDAQVLLAALADRGWFVWHPETERWKTHLG